MAKYSKIVKDLGLQPAYWPRMDRCIDYIWISEDVKIIESGVCFDKTSPGDLSFWPSDHAGVWADLEITGAGKST